MKKLAIILVLALCLVLTSCGQPASTPSGEPSPSDGASTPSAEVSAEPTVPADESAEPTPDEGEKTATLYIGTKAGGFSEYPMTYEGELTPELLIQGIADLTGWDLTLDEPVISGKGGMSVCLSSGSSLFVGPPEEQKDEFHMYDAEQLAETILDSIQRTLQKGFVLEPGDPDNLDIWYYSEGDEPLELPNLGLSWAIDQPYQWASAVRAE